MTFLGPRKLLELSNRRSLAWLSLKECFSEINTSPKEETSKFEHVKPKLVAGHQPENGKTNLKVSLIDKVEKSRMELQNAGDRIEECSYLETKMTLRKRDTQPRNRQPASGGVRDSVEDAKNSMEVLKSMLKRQALFQDFESASWDFHSNNEQLVYAWVKMPGLLTQNKLF